jgi:hypothetical protein
VRLPETASNGDHPIVEGAYMRAATVFIAIALLITMIVVDPGVSPAVVDAFSSISHNITAGLSAHPIEAVVALGTASFTVDPLDQTYTLAEWRQLRRVSASTERRMRKLGLGPRLVFLSQGRLGVTRKDDLAWEKAGGASSTSAQSADPPAVQRNTGRDTRAATTASVAKRAERKSAAPITSPPPVTAAPAELATTPESVNAA